MANLVLQQKIINAIHKVYKKAFSDTIYYVSQTGEKDPVYDEYMSVGSAETVTLIGKVNLTPSLDDVPVKEMRVDAKFDIPLKCFRDLGIDIENLDNHKELRKGYILYNGVTYDINSINPSTFIADAFVLYSFNCTERKNR